MPRLAAARDRFAGWPSWVHDLLAATLADRLIRNDVYHLPHGPSSYAAGRVVLVGDAAPRLPAHRSSVTRWAPP